MSREGDGQANDSDDLIVEPTAEQMEQLRERRREFLAAQQTDGRSGKWHDPDTWSPSNQMKYEFFERIEELEHKALVELHNQVLPKYRTLFDAGVLGAPRGLLDVRHSSGGTSLKMAEEPALVFLFLGHHAQPEENEIVNSFIEAFEHWCWRRGFLDKWMWTRPLETLVWWTVYCTEPKRPLEWAPAYSWDQGGAVELGDESGDIEVEARPKNVMVTIRPWLPLIIDREPYLEMVNRRLDAAEDKMRELGFKERPKKRKSRRKNSEGDDPDDLDRHLRWFVQIQVGGKTQTTVAFDENVIVQQVRKAYEKTATELGITRRTMVKRADWSVAKVLAKNMGS